MEYQTSRHVGQHDMWDNMAPVLTHAHECTGAGNHENGLDKVGPDDGREPSGDGEDGSNGQQDQDADVHPLIAVFVQRLLDEQRPGVEVSLTRRERPQSCNMNQ